MNHFLRLYCCFTIFILGLLAFSQGMAIDSDDGIRVLTDVQIISENKGVRVKVIGNKKLDEYKSFFLKDKNAPKWIVDLPGVLINAAKPSYNPKNEIVKKIRIGEHPDFVRIVFDLGTVRPLVHTITEDENGLALILRKKKYKTKTHSLVSETPPTVSERSEPKRKTFRFDNTESFIPEKKNDPPDLIRVDDKQEDVFAKKKQKTLQASEYEKWQKDFHVKNPESKQSFDSFESPKQFPRRLRTGNAEMYALCGYMISNDFVLDDVSFHFEDAVMGGIGTGYHFNQHFFVNTEFFYGQSELTAPGSGHDFVADTAVFGGNINLEINLFKASFTPFVTGGVGFFTFDGDINGSDFRETVFSYSAGAGLRWEINTWLVIKTAWRMTWTQLDDFHETTRFNRFSLMIGFLL
jgi:opacity protein-like surface antigen